MMSQRQALLGSFFTAVETEVQGFSLRPTVVGGRSGPVGLQSPSCASPVPAYQFFLHLPPAGHRGAEAGAVSLEGGLGGEHGAGDSHQTSSRVCSRGSRAEHEHKVNTLEAALESQRLEETRGGVSV